MQNQSIPPKPTNVTRNLIITVLILIGLPTIIILFMKINTPQTYYVKSESAHIYNSPVADNSTKALGKYDSIKVYKFKSKNGFFKTSNNQWVIKSDLFLDQNNPDLTDYLAKIKKEQLEKKRQLEKARLEKQSQAILAL